MLYGQWRDARGSYLPITKPTGVFQLGRSEGGAMAERNLPIAHEPPGDAAPISHDRISAAAWEAAPEPQAPGKGGRLGSA
jgi:hypothetical protein